jgi:hypothetical protein
LVASVIWRSNKHAGEGQQSVGAAVWCKCFVAECPSDAVARDGRLLVGMPERVEAGADELAPHSGLPDRRLLFGWMERTVAVIGVVDSLVRDAPGTGSWWGRSRG